MARSKKGKPGYKGDMTAAELGKLSNGGQRTHELIEKGKALEDLERRVQAEVDEISDQPRKKRVA